MTDPQKIISWLQYLDVEYLSNSLSNKLADLDVNNPADQEEIIRLAMDEEVRTLNSTSRESMRKILEEVEAYREVEVRSILNRVGMPFAAPLLDYKSFFDRVRKHFFPQ